MRFDPSDHDKLLASLICCVLSVFFTSVAIYFYIKYGDLRKNFSAQLVFILALSDLLCWIQVTISDAYLLGSGKTSASIEYHVCIMLGFFSNFTSVVTLATVFFISFLIYLNVVWFIPIERYRLVFVSSTAIFVLILSFLPLFMHSYGPTDDILCWINGPNMVFYGYYLIILIVFMIDFYCIAHCLYKIHIIPFPNQIRSKLRRHITFFPIILLGSWSAGLVNSFLGILNVDINSEVINIISLLDYILEPLEGVFNPIAYMMINEKVKIGFINALRWRRDQDVENHEEEIYNIALSY